MRTTMTRLLLAAALATGLVACGGTTETSDLDILDPGATNSAGDGTDDTSMPADDDVQDDGTVTEAEAEAVATAYLGLSEEEALAQAEIDGRPYRVGARDGEQFVLTEDFVVGRITVTIENGIVTAATVEGTDGEVSVVS